MQLFEEKKKRRVHLKPILSPGVLVFLQALSDVKKVVKSKLKTLPGQCSSLLGPICQLGNVDVGDFPYNQPRVLPKLPGYKDTLPNNEQQGK